jgi:predicted transcriptional regulator
MPNKQSVLISIKQKYVESIISGEKKAEIRRLFPANPNISRVYVYVPTPERHIVGYFEIKEIFMLPIEELWEASGKLSALSRDEFSKYLFGKEVGTSVHFDRLTLLAHKPTLNELRKSIPSFHPPQSFMYLTDSLEKLLHND